MEPFTEMFGGLYKNSQKENDVLDEYATADDFATEASVF